jgi:hypothetical protein
MMGLKLIARLPVCKNKKKRLVLLTIEFKRIARPPVCKKKNILQETIFYYRVEKFMARVQDCWGIGLGIRECRV